ncbi:TPA: hypothetical protein ACN7MG_003314 [Klebsiella pneumoniae]|nr:hypothetical protein [Klebsiella pneumoniae]
MISNMHSTQHWLKQFSKAHRVIAESLLNSLVYINSSSLIMDLKEVILENENKEKVSILPIRELDDNEQIFDLKNKTTPPNCKLQINLWVVKHSFQTYILNSIEKTRFTSR